MSEVTMKTSIKKGFKAPIMKDNVKKGDSSAHSAENKQKKTPKPKEPSTDKVDHNANNNRSEDKDPKLKHNKKKAEKNDGKHSETENKFPKPQSSLTNSQYDAIFDAVIEGRKSNPSSQHNTPEEVMSVIEEMHKQSTSSRNSKEDCDNCLSVPATPVQKSKVLSHVSSSRGSSIPKPQSSLTNSQYDAIFDAVIEGRKSNPSSQHNTPEEILSLIEEIQKQSTPSRKSKENRDKCMSVPTTPVQKSKVLSQVSPWGSHFSKQASQGSSILKELQESQNSPVKSISESSPSSSYSDSSETSQQMSPQSSLQLKSRGNQRKRLEDLQRHRNVGVWVFCDRESCQKQRYLPHITDPQDLPDVWFCHMNPDPKYNSCQSEEQVVSLEEEEDMIYNSFTAGSVVWARVAGYPWWPAMVDDDPDLEQYYWLLEDMFTVTHYHVVFFDEGAITRAWVDLKNISSYSRHDNKYKQRSCRGIDFSRRIQVAKEQANDALTMTSYERLTVYSFIARYKGPITTSHGKAQNTMKKYKLKSKKENKATGRKFSSKKDGKKCQPDAFNKLNMKEDETQKKQNKSIKRKKEISDLEKSSLGPKNRKVQKVNNEKYDAKKNVGDILLNEDKDALKSANKILKTHNITKKNKSSNRKSEKDDFLNPNEVEMEETYLTEKNITQDNKSNNNDEQESEETKNECNQSNENHIETNKKSTNEPTTQAESETPSIIEGSDTNKSNAVCSPGPSNQTTNDTKSKNVSTLSGSETGSFIEINKENTKNDKTQSESETPSIIEGSDTNNAHAFCLPGPSNQTTNDTKSKNVSTLSGSKTPSIIEGDVADESLYQPESSQFNTEDAIESIEPSQIDTSQESKHSLSQSTIADFLASEHEDGIVPSVAGFSQNSLCSLPFEE